MKNFCSADKALGVLPRCTDELPGYVRAGENHVPLAKIALLKVLNFIKNKTSAVSAEEITIPASSGNSLIC